MQAVTVRSSLYSLEHGQPTVSVVMAVHNGEPYLEEAIDSILGQSLEDFEFLIVDDASTDGTARILSAYGRQDRRIRILTTERTSGPFGSANLALDRARGLFIANQDADDISHPDRLGAQLEVLASDPNVALVSGPIDVFDSNTGVSTRIHRPRSWQPRLEWELLFANAGGTSANVMFPRAFRGAAIRYPAMHRFAEDYGLWCTLSRAGRVVSLPAVLYRYREHNLSITACRRPEQDACMSDIRRAYVSHYLGGVDDGVIGEALRFWNREADVPFTYDIRVIAAVLAELRSTFLDYVEQRYGLDDRNMLERQVERAFHERLEFWLCRSLRFLDGTATGELLSLAREKGAALQVSGQAISSLVTAAAQKLGRSVMRPRRSFKPDSVPTLSSS